MDLCFAFVHPAAPIQRALARKDVFLLSLDGRVQFSFENKSKKPKGEKRGTKAQRKCQRGWTAK
jgi:hypothetical protein